MGYPSFRRRRSEEEKEVVEGRRPRSRQTPAFEARRRYVARYFAAKAAVKAKDAELAQLRRQVDAERQLAAAESAEASAQRDARRQLDASLAAKDAELQAMKVALATATAAAAAATANAAAPLAPSVDDVPSPEPVGAPPPPAGRRGTKRALDNEVPAIGLEEATVKLCERVRSNDDKTVLRRLYDKLLERTKHVKVWLSYAACRGRAKTRTRPSLLGGLVLGASCFLTLANSSQTTMGSLRSATQVDSVCPKAKTVLARRAIGDSEKFGKLDF